MKLTIIGCSGSMSGVASPASAYLLQAWGEDPVTKLPRQYSLTLDFGPGAMGALLKYLDPRDLDAMIFSHLHTDHCADIVGMQVYRRWHPSGSLPAVPVYSPGDGLARTRGIGGDGEEETYSGEFSFHPISPGDQLTLGPMKLSFFRARHTVPALGIRVAGPSEWEKITSSEGIEVAKTVTFCYTGDTDYCRSEVEAARSVDLLLSESAFEEGRDTVEGVHMTGARAGRLASEAGAKRVLLTHLQPWTSPQKVQEDARMHYSGPLECVEAGGVYEF